MSKCTRIVLVIGSGKLTIITCRTNMIDPSPKWVIKACDQWLTEISPEYKSPEVNVFTAQEKQKSYHKNRQELPIKPNPLAITSSLKVPELYGL